MSKAPDIQPDVETISVPDPSPFKKLVLSFGGIPTDFKESMTYYEMLAWLCNFIEKDLMSAIDGYAQKYNELIEAFNQLKNYCDNYFKNLDVQEEINNKLDEMAESGELERIIATYLDHAVLVRNTINDFINDSDIPENVIIKTLGYHSVNDGGGAYYLTRQKDTSDVEDGGSIIFIQNNLVGELINDKFINVKQFGAIGDGATDDRVAIQNSINYIHNKGGGTVYIPTGTYLLSTTPYYKLDESQRGIMSLMLYDNIRIKGELNTILTVPNQSWGSGAYYRMICTHEETRAGNITIEDITLDGNGANNTNSQQASNILISATHDIKIHNVISKNCNGNGIMVRGIPTDVATNVEISDCEVSNCTKIGIQSSHFKNLTITNNQVNNTTDNCIDIYGNDAENRVISSSQFVISDNIVSNGLAGIFPETVENGVVEGNSITNCQIGVRVNSINAQSNNILISSNEIRTCGIGISFVGPQTFNYAMSNVITGYTTTAFQFQTTNRQVIRDNIITPTSNLPIITTAGEYVNHVSAMHNYIETLGSSVTITTIVQHNATTETGDIFKFEDPGTYLWKDGGQKINNQYFQINMPTDTSWRGKLVIRIGNTQITEVSAVYIKNTGLQFGSRNNVYLASGATDDITKINPYANIRALVYTSSSTSISYQIQIEQQW